MKGQPIPEPTGHPRHPQAQAKKGCRCAYCKEVRRRTLNRRPPEDYADRIERQLRYMDQRHEQWTGELDIR